MRSCFNGRDDALTGADVMESTLAAVPSAQNALTLGGKPASAFLGSDKQQRSGLIKLTHGADQDHRLKRAVHLESRLQRRRRWQHAPSSHPPDHRSR